MHDGDTAYFGVADSKLFAPIFTLSIILFYSYGAILQIAIECQAVPMVSRAV